MSHVGVDGAAVPDVVGGVRVGGPEDAFAHQERLHSHLVGVADDVLQLVEALHLQSVLIGGDWRGHHYFGNNEFPIAVSGKRGIGA